jgi:hypothetical protein
MIERCGDRQRKLDGLERWPFRLFIESLPVMLQIALLLLSCGLSRYVWSVNTSVARVVISFTVLGVIFYVGIVIAGTSSYECPFQTPASTALRALRGKKATRRLLASLSPLSVMSSVYIAWRDVRQGFASRYRGIRDAVMDPQSWRSPPPQHFRYGHERRTPNHHSAPPCRSRFRECKAEARSSGSKVHTCNTASNRPHRPSATLTATSRWASHPGKEHRKPSEVERRQCALCVLDHPQHHRP